MADSTLEAKVLLDVGQLKSAVASARQALDNLGGAVGGLDAKLKKADKALTKGASAHQILASAGIRTEAGITAQIAALEHLKTVAGQDAVALRQISAEQQRLRAMIHPANKALEEQAKAVAAAGRGSKDLGDKMTHAGAASHRANLFMINFSRGVEDLKFGLPAVINNLEGIALGYQMMAKEAKAAEKSVVSVMAASLMSPAGMLAILNLVITTAFLLGPTLKKAFNEAGASAKQLRDSVSGMLGDIKTDTGTEFALPDSPAEIRALADEFRNYAGEVRSAAIEQGKFTDEWVSFGGQAVKVQVLSADAAEEFRRVRDASNGAKERLEAMADEMEANSIAAEILGKKLTTVNKAFADVAKNAPGTVNFYEAMISYYKELIGTMSDPSAIAGMTAVIEKLEAALARLRGDKVDPVAVSGSIAKAKEDIERLQEAFEYAASSSARERIRKQIEALERQLASMTFVQDNLVRATKEYETELESIEIVIDPLAGSLEELADKLEHANFMFSNAASDTDRERWAAQVRSITDDIDNLRKALDAPLPAGSWAAVDKVVADLDRQLGLATTSTERLSIAQKMHAQRVLPELEREIMDVNDALADFRRNSALALGEAAVGGAFEGFFGGFDKADADRARLAIIETKKAFAGLEEQFASGEITYEEFALRNKILTGEMRDAQEELAKATRDNFELMADRIGNAFEAVARSVKKAFASIAQDYVNMIVRKGILKLFGTALGIAPGLGGSAALGVLSSGVSIPDIPSVSAGAAPLGRAQNIGLIATLIPSGDIRIAGEKSSAIRSRLGV